MVFDLRLHVNNDIFKVMGEMICNLNLENFSSSRG